jgi:hypothetical protein
MATHSFHYVTKVVAQQNSFVAQQHSYEKEKIEWIKLIIFEDEFDGQVETRFTLYFKDAALADRLVAAINAAQVVEIEEAA